MQLLDSKTSPFCRKVRLVMHELGHADDIELIPSGGSPLDASAGAMAVNPLGKVPCLVRPDGPALHDSRVICRYLDALWGGRLYPEGEGLWSALTLEATADGIMEAGLLTVYEERLREEGARSAAWVAGQRRKVARAIAVIEERWMSHLNGPLDMGVIAAAAALGYVDFRLSDIGWRDAHPALAHWFDEFSSRPSMQATRPD